MLLQDAEAFQESALALEHIAQLAGAPIGIGLGRSRGAILSLLAGEEESTKKNARSLFDVVLEARNMAVHDGAWIRHRSNQLLELLLVLEEATMCQLMTIEQVMVKSAVVAESHQRLAHARRTMLSNSFSFLHLKL